MKIDNLTLDTESPLPLVPYFSHDAPDVSLSLSRETAKQAYINSALARAAVESVLHENYKRRVQEAAGASKALRDYYFHPDGTFREEVHDEIDDYTRFRCIDANQHATIAERVGLFLDSSHPEPLKAYEIFAHSRDPKEDMLDLSFAHHCLKLISPSTAVEEVEPRLPKLSRKIEVDDTDQRVVTTKARVGSFQWAGGDIIRLTSRQAGLIDYRQLESHEQAVVDYLTYYDRRLGRTEELDHAKTTLRDILSNKPVQPVVESLYLTREPEESC